MASSDHTYKISTTANSLEKATRLFGQKEQAASAKVKLPVPSEQKYEVSYQFSGTAPDEGVVLPALRGRSTESLEDAIKKADKVLRATGQPGNYTATQYSIDVVYKVTGEQINKLTADVPVAGPHSNDLRSKRSMW